MTPVTASDWLLFLASSLQSLHTKFSKKRILPQLVLFNPFRFNDHQKYQICVKNQADINKFQFVGCSVEKVQQSDNMELISAKLCIDFACQPTFA